ncbi:SDR family NAD(P)-dependent oxidoreductase [Pontibacter akesuensis]|uniref:Short-chain dehydrogenase n=1 Tax=Pontibacter akesuensis TaxID=388950 RepID=A0A1I7GLR4_9BACT|nr:SDR family NAD(P)-dependent oxidoreductase [Pontibacter akesuensis]GHA56123.1 short chain dehydrogenase [Pontibacter akesuensis]SFU49375.1 Short-chain dehydrogenase [Pontibacter akesuensis]
MDLKNKKVLITGGSAGIGKALIKELAARGVQDIAVVGRRREPLEALQSEFDNVNFLPIQGNVASVEDLDRVVSEVTETWGELDILINNAGVVSAGLLHEVSDEDVINQININVTGLILLTKKALPLLQKSEAGAIMNVSSGYGYIAMPFYSVYAATKAAVGQFSDAMRRELHQYPLHVMTVYPSATDTDMMKTAVVGDMDSADDVARAAVEGLLNKEINVILGGKQREEQIKTNFLEPQKIDEFAVANFAALRERTLKHRSM